MLVIVKAKRLIFNIVITYHYNI